MLKKTIFRSVIAVAIFLTSSATVFAQDVITLNNGVDIKVVVEEVRMNDIRYKRFDNLNGPVYTLPKSEIFRIVYENGTMDVFSGNTVNTITSETPQQTQYSRPVNHPTTSSQVITQQPQNDESQPAQPVQQTQSAPITQTSVGRKENVAISFGAFMGGGGLIGFDLETLVGKRVGFQAGVGLVSFGLGLNYHIKPYINSSFATFHYKHLGFGANHIASTIGPGFTFRARKIFQAGVDFGYVVNRGYSFYDAVKNPDTNLFINFQIGLYFPL